MRFLTLILLLFTLNSYSQDLSRYTPQQVLDAIIEVESTTGKNTYNRNEPEAVGILQQYPIYVQDVNRIIGQDLYKLSDRNDPVKAKQMFWIYQQFYNPTFDREKIIRIHCGGPDGWKQDCTLKYFELVKKQLKTNN